MKNTSKLFVLAFAVCMLSLSFVIAEDAVTITPASSNIKTITINDINVPALIEKGSSGTIDVLVSNSGSKGMFLVTASSDQMSLNPSAQNMALEGQKTIHYSYSVQNTAGSGNLCIKVCTVNQFGDNGCTDQCKLFNIIDKVTPQNSNSNNSIAIAVIIAVAIIIGFIIFAILSRRNKK